MDNINEHPIYKKIIDVLEFVGILKICEVLKIFIVKIRRFIFYKIIVRYYTKLYKTIQNPGNGKMLLLSL